METKRQPRTTPLNLEDVAKRVKDKGSSDYRIEGIVICSQHDASCRGFNWELRHLIVPEANAREQRSWTAFGRSRCGTYHRWWSCATARSHKSLPGASNSGVSEHRLR